MMIRFWWVGVRVSATHGVLGSTTSLVVDSGVSVKSYQPLTPVKLNHHKAIEIGVVMWARQIAVCLDQRVSRRFWAREVIHHLGWGVVVGIAESLNIREPLHVFAVVLEPDCSMESHFIVLIEKISTIVSIAFESLLKISSKTLSRS